MTKPIRAPIRATLCAVVCAALCTGSLVPVFAEPRASAAATDEVDHVALAVRLAADGHFDRASSVLEGVPEPDVAAQRADYHTVLGLVALREKRFAEAAAHLDQAIFAGKTDELIFVYLAQAHWGLQDFETTLRMIRNAETLGATSAPLQLVRVQSLWKLNRLHEAYEVARAASTRFADEPRFSRMTLFLLVELGLHQEAITHAETYFDSEAPVVVDDYLAFGQALLASGQADAAASFLERAHLQFPNNPRVAAQFAAALSAAGLPHAAGDVLQRAAGEDDAMLLESARMYRRAGALDRALYMNAQVADQRAKLLQRVGILSDRQDFEAVAAMVDRLERLGLFEDQSVLYAAAYARFQIGDYEGAEELLGRIQDAALFQNANSLRQVMAYCAENPC